MKNEYEIKISYLQIFIICMLIGLGFAVYKYGYEDGLTQGKLEGYQYGYQYGYKLAINEVSDKILNQCRKLNQTIVPIQCPHEK